MHSPKRIKLWEKSFELNLEGILLGLKAISVTFCYMALVRRTLILDHWGSVLNTRKYDNLYMLLFLKDGCTQGLGTCDSDR